MTDKKWLFLNNYRTKEQANESKEAHIKTWGDLYPKAEYRIEYCQTFCDNYLLYVNLNESEEVRIGDFILIPNYNTRQDDLKRYIRG